MVLDFKGKLLYNEYFIFNYDSKNQKNSLISTSEIPVWPGMTNALSEFWNKSYIISVSRLVKSLNL